MLILHLFSIWSMLFRARAHSHSYSPSIFVRRQIQLSERMEKNFFDNLTGFVVWAPIKATQTKLFFFVNNNTMQFERREIERDEEKERERSGACAFYDDVNAGDWATRDPLTSFRLLFYLFCVLHSYVITNDFVNKSNWYEWHHTILSRDACHALISGPRNFEWKWRRRAES